MSPAIDCLSGAVATPLQPVSPGSGSSTRIRFVGGILDAAGRPHVASNLRRRGMTLQAPSPAVGERAVCPGRWLYGGIWFEHYGHFLLETLARAWHLIDATGPVMFHRRPQGATGEIPTTMQPWQRELITALLGSASRVHFVTAPTEFEELVVAEAGSIIGERCTTAQAAALAAIGGRIAAGGAPSPGPASRRLWLSRSAAPKGRILGEEEFERALAAVGFEVIHPQTMTLAEQVRAFDEAVLVAGFTGSAFHTALLAGRRTAELVHFARFTAQLKQYAICAAAAGYPSRFHDCFIGFEPALDAQATSPLAAIPAALDIRQDFGAVWRILHELGAVPQAVPAPAERGDRSDPLAQAPRSASP